jgi:uncharacterized protein YjiS (DUF1127 family)
MNTFFENFSYNFVPGRFTTRSSLLQVLRGFLDNEKLKHQIHRERLQLLSMSDAQLMDIGVDHFQAEQEAQRSDMPVDRLKPSSL